MGQALWLRSTTARMFIPIALFQTLVAAGIVGFVWVAGNSALRRQHDALVAELQADLIEDYREGGIADLRREIAVRIREKGPRAPVMLLLDPQGRRIEGNIDTWPTRLTATSVTLHLRRAGESMPEEMTVFTSRLDGGYRLVVGWALREDRQLRTSYEGALSVALLLSIPLALLVSLLISGSISRRIQALAQTAHSVATGSLHARVLLDGSGDSFDQLGKRINEMLERIEALVGELRLVTDGLAHDLRSPLTRLKSVIERAALETTDARALAGLERAAVEADALMTMLGTALQITRAEAGISRDSLVPTDVREFLADLQELYAPLVEDRGFTLELEAEEGITVPLNREMVGQTIGNLIDNASKYATGGDRIVLSAHRQGRSAEIRVSDNGPGIPAAQRAEALRRFGRLDPARGIAGSGLGLALADVVARIHGGTLELADNDPGLVVRFVVSAAG